MKGKILTACLVLALLLKLFIDGFVDINKFGGQFKSINLHKQLSFYSNPDDGEMAQVARNVLIGKGFVTDISFDRPKFRTDTEWQTAFRPKLNVLVHVAGLKIYLLLHPDYNITADKNIPAPYFEALAKTIFAVKNLLFIISLFYFFRLAGLFLSKNRALMATILYCVYPSIILYVGMINIFECLIMPCLVIIISTHLYNRRKNKPFSFFEILFFALAIPVICFLKMQVSLIMIFLYLVMLADVILEPTRIKQYLLAYMPANIIIALFAFYTINSNYQATGRAIISNQSALNLFHGNNPFAKGSWNPIVWKQYAKEIDPILEKNKDKLSSDEFTETQFYKTWALEWIKTHPKQELLLCLRKFIIYFLPNNSNCWKINPITLFVHICFFGFICFFFIGKFRNIEFLYILAPVTAILAVNLIFFVEYRWRYLADPFMVLAAFVFIDFVLNKMKPKSSLPNTSDN